MAATLGATAPVAYLLCAIAMGLIVLCMAEAGSRVALTGGPYAYVEVAFGPFVGFLAGFLLWMLLTFAMAAVATVLAASLGALVPALASPAASAATLVAIYVVFATVNILGVERGARVNSHHRRQDPAAAAAHRRRPVRDRPGQSRRDDAAGHGNAGAEQHPADLCVRRHRGGAGAGRRSARAGAHGAARDLLSRWSSSRCSTPACSSSRRACSARRSRRRRRRRSPTRPASRSAAGRGTLLLVGAVISMLGHAGAMTLATPRTLFAFARDGFLPAILRARSSVHRSPVAAIVAAVRDRARASRSAARSSGWRSSPTSRRWCSTSRAAWRRGSSVAATCARAARRSACRLPGS